MTQHDGHERSAHTVDSQRARHAVSSVSLLDVEPELGSLLAGEQLEQARRFALPTRTFKRGADVIRTLRETDAFGAIVLDGLLLHGTQIGTRPALRLVEPGDIVPFTRSTPAIPVATDNVRAATRSRIVLLDGHVLVATQRWPQLAALTFSRTAESSERIAVQLAISHLPRVNERLMALMWLLAERRGHVTASGIRLRLALTHEAIGGLIGAQRPTVTLALKELAERGSLIRQDEDWVILDPPPEPQTVKLEPQLVDAPDQVSAWSPPAESEPQDGRLALLRAELVRLRDQNAPDRALAHDLADQAKQLRARTHDLVFDAHLLTDVSRQEHEAAAATVRPRRDRFADRRQKPSRGK